MNINEQIQDILDATLEVEGWDYTVHSIEGKEDAAKKLEALLLQSQVDLLNEVYDLIGTDSPKSSIKEMISELKQQIYNLSK